MSQAHHPFFLGADFLTLAHRAATRIWHDLGIPSHLYGAAATAAHRANLADVRRGEFEGLSERIRDPQWRFDYGDVPHPTAGSMKLVRSPMKMSGSPTDNAIAPPLLGQHTDEILRDMLGRSDADIAALRAKGVL